ncbi:flocculation FLO11-like protein [Perilla frutescens var. hirtella]|nr:flocculation FLO11-like protein [Perilla frutescens var. hirtella]KAH6805593.1 flocculation FLO11-like protein [Perilla frutescens var. frutescens]
MNRSFRAPERGHLGSLRLRDNKDEELALFREMRKREKERNDLLLLQNSDEFDAPLGPRSGSSPIFNIASGTTAPVRKNVADDFLNSDNDKNDYDWLLTPPGTPLFPSLEMEAHKTVMSQLGTPKPRPTALKSRLANAQPEPAARSTSSSRLQVSSPGLNTSTGGLRRPSSSGGSGSRPVTPTGRPTVSATSRSTLTSTSNKPALTAAVKTTSNATSKVTSTITSKPSRSATPTRPTLSKPTAPPRSSTPTARSTARSSTPTSRASIPASKSTSRASTPTRRPTPSAATKSPVVSSKSPTASSVVKPVSTSAKNPMPTRSNSPTARPRPWKPSEMPGFSLDAPPNLRTSLSDRPPSATRGRPGAPSSRSSSIEPVSNGRIRRQSCSPARGRPPNGIIHNSGSSVPVHAASRLHAKANDNVSPALVGTKMVERVINMRKLAPPRQDDKHSPHSNLSGKSSSPDSAGFGRTLSKKSLDMAIRHMDIRRTIPGNLRPLMTNIPASSMYSVRSGPTRKATSVSDSPLATSSNASSEMSVNNNALCMDGPEIYEDVSSDKGIRSPASLRGR